MTQWNESGTKKVQKLHSPPRIIPNATFTEANEWIDVNIAIANCKEVMPNNVPISKRYKSEETLKGTACVDAKNNMWKDEVTNQKIYKSSKQLKITWKAYIAHIVGPWTALRRTDREERQGRRKTSIAVNSK